MRHAHQPGMDRQVEDLPALLVQQLEGIAHDVGIARGRDAPQPELLDVVPFRLAGQRHELAADLHRIGLVVVRPVEHVIEAGIGQKLRRALALAVVLAEPAGRAHARRLLDRGEGFGDLGLLLGLRHLRGDHAVGRVAVGDELVLPLLELLDQVGIALGGQRVHRHAGADLVAVEHVEHAEDADPVAVVALRPGAVVGHVGAELADVARVLVAVGGGVELPVLEVQYHERGDARIARPGEPRTLRKRRVVVPGIVHPGRKRRRVLGNGGAAHVTPPSRGAAGTVSARWPRSGRGSPRRCRPRRPCAGGCRPAPGRDASGDAAPPSCRDGARCT